LHVAFDCGFGIFENVLSDSQQSKDMFGCSDIANPNICLVALYALKSFPYHF